MHELTSPPTPEEMAYGAALAVIADVDAWEERVRPLVYCLSIAMLKTAHPEFFDETPAVYDSALFAAARRQAFGNTPKHVVEQFLFGRALCEPRTEPTQEEKVH